MDWRAYAGTPPLDEFVAVEADGARVLVRRGMEGAVPSIVAAMDVDHWTHKVWMPGGREDHPVVDLPDGDHAVVRRYRRGGFVRRFNRDRYFGGDRAFLELRATEAARRGGVRTLEVVAAAQLPAGFGYRALLATRIVESTLSLFDFVEVYTAAQIVPMMREAGRQIGLLHEAGIGHPDLNVRNLLVTRAPPPPPRRVRRQAGAGPVLPYDVWVIDLDRAKEHPGPVPVERRRQDLLRLARSVRKARLSLAREEWDALAEGYGAAWPPRLTLG